VSVDILSSPAVIWAWSGTCDVAEIHLGCGWSDIWSTTFVAGRMEGGETVHFAVAGSIGGRELGKVTLNAMPLHCGDGLQARSEECDDGNVTDGDGCSAACLLETANEGR
jgi:cysteine-rich repeat protein